MARIRTNGDLFHQGRDPFFLVREHSCHSWPLFPSASLRLCGSRFSFLSPFAAVALCLAFLSSGCAGPGIPVQLTPTQSNKTLGVTFTRAYYAPSLSGEEQIVLVSDPIDEPTKTPPGAPLPAIQSPPIWHVLLIELHWRNTTSGNPDSPVASNAALHWYVFGKPTDNSSGLLHYAGQGSVRFSAGNTNADVTVQSGDMTLVDQHGPLRDPFHSFHVRTAFHALSDAGRLKQVMDDVQGAIVNSDQPQEALPQRR